MKILFFLSVIVLASFGNTAAQTIPGVPDGSAGKNSRDEYDNGTRLRSIALERIKRDSYRSAAAKSAENRRINYSQIKKDFETMQKLQSGIIKTYITGKEINYKAIGELALKLNESAKRLDGNLQLFAEKPLKKSNKKISDSENVSDLIVALDKSIGTFVSSKIFQNLNVIETEDSEKAGLELQNIIRLSDFLAVQSEKQQ